MPIRSHLNGRRFDSETMRVMGLAYEMTLVSLRLLDRGDIANDVVASKIIELAKAGERDPERDEAVTVNVSSLFSILSSIAASTLSMKPVSGLQKGEFGKTTSSMPLGKKKCVALSTKRPWSKLQKPPLE